MSTGTHRKAADGDLGTPAAPWHYYAVGAILFALAVILVVSVSLLGAQPAQASTVSYLHPAVTAAKAVDHGYTGKADRVTQWQHVLRHCQKVGCTSHVPDAMRRDMGIRPGQAYRVHWGDTTFVWVRLPHGRVRTITS